MHHVPLKAPCPGASRSLEDMSKGKLIEILQALFFRINRCKPLLRTVNGPSWASTYKSVVLKLRLCKAYIALWTPTRVLASSVLNQMLNEAARRPKST